MLCTSCMVNLPVPSLVQRFPTSGVTLDLGDRVQAHSGHCTVHCTMGCASMMGVHCALYDGVCQRCSLQSTAPVCCHSLPISHLLYTSILSATMKAE